MSPTVDPGEVGALVGALFRPIDMAGRRIANRIVMAPMTRKFAVGGVNSPAAVDYYSRRARMGCGLIITEGIATSDLAAHSADVPHMRTPAQQAIWREVTDAVHAAGGTILAQLWHCGLGRLRHAAANPEEPSVGPMDYFLDPASPLAEAMQGNNPPGRALGDRDIADLIAEFAQAARDARACGFDGIELHGAHGYLLDQFLWGESNRRTDRWGGDIAERTRFPVEVIKAIRAATAPSFIVGLRFSQWKSPYHYDVKVWRTPQELEQALVPLAAAGPDFLDASTRRYWEPEFAGSDLPLAGWARKLTGLPAMAIGSVGIDLAFESRLKDAAAAPTNNLGRALDLLARDEIDLLGVGRAYIANPDWADKVREGRMEELKPYNAEALGQYV